MDFVITRPSSIGVTEIQECEANEQTNDGGTAYHGARADRTRCTDGCALSPQKNGCTRKADSRCGEQD